MCKIYLCDNVNDGHHSVYQNSLASGIQNTIILNKIMKCTDMKKNPFKGYKERKTIIDYINLNSESHSIVHFLYLDVLYKSPCISYLLRKDRVYIGTLHWIPKDKLTILFLRKISKKLKYLIVHSEYLKRELEKLQIFNVICIDYPSFIDKKIKINKANSDKVIISCLGGTRLDKGLDILIDAFQYIEETVKDKIVFNICGIEQDIKYEDIISTAQQYGINIQTKNKYLSDLEYQTEIINSDIILLPYKKIFNGNSGPMTDGIYLGKFIIGPEEGNLGYLIKEHQLGKCFKQENPIDLARVISEIIDINLSISSTYKQEVDVNKFLNKHKQLYNKCY